MDRRFIFEVGTTAAHILGSIATAAAFSLDEDELLVAEALFAWIADLDSPAESAASRECRAWILLDAIATGHGLSVVELRQQADAAVQEGGASNGKRASGYDL